MSENRTAYRKNLKVDGTLVCGDLELAFFTKNVSLSGFQGCAEPVPGVESLETSDMVYVRLPHLHLEGVVSILWSRIDADGLFNFGFKFLSMRGVEGSAYHYRESDHDNG